MRTFALAVMMTAAIVGTNSRAAARPEDEVHDFIARWNAAYTRLDAGALANLETPDFQMVDRFGHWIQSEGADFNRELWARTFQEIYKGHAGPARKIESIRFLSPDVAVVQARAWHSEPVVLDDGTRIPPFWEIDTYTLIKTDGAWRVSVMNIHNQIDAGAERPGEHVPYRKQDPLAR